MKTKKSKKGWTTINVDMEKANDRVRWDFLRGTLLDAKLPGALVKIIMNCVSSSSMQLLWNGLLTESFTPTRGVRQGDPSFLYLFVLGIGRL